MSSADVAAYLYEVGSNERKLQYCRQILASNPNFTPEAVFNFAATQPRSNLSRSEFAELLKALGVSSTPQEAELVFSYFQIDGKNYISLDEFASLIAPQADPSLRSLMGKRREGFVLDYGVRYALQKFIGQVVSNQVRLELLCKFTFEKQREEKSKFKRATADALKEFLAHHGKYPGEAQVALILKEAGLNKGDSKRNRLITEYILAFNDRKRTNQDPPKVYQRELADFTAKYQSTIQQQQAIASSKLQTALKPEFSQLFSKTPSIHPSHTQQQREIEQAVARTTQFASTISNVSQVEDRIKNLMGSINISNRPSAKKEEDRPLPLDSARPPVVKEQVKREKQPSSGASKSISKRLDFKDKESIIKDLSSNGDRSERRDLTDRPQSTLDYPSYTDRNKTDRLLRNRRITEDNFEAESNNSGSRVHIQKKPVPGKYTESQSKKRIEYLRSLVDRKENI